MINVGKLENNIDHVSFNNLEKFDSLVADDIKNQLVKLFEVPNARVIINLEGIKYIDSSGFGCFLTTMKAARNNYGILKICNIESQILSLFKSLQLHTVFDLQYDLESCINSF